jgi:hypothetical protein
MHCTSRLRCLSLAHFPLPRLEISNATAVRVKLTSPVEQRLNVVPSPPGTRKVRKTTLSHRKKQDASKGHRYRSIQRTVAHFT